MFAGLHGAKVVIASRRKKVLSDATHSLQEAGIQAHFVQGDVRRAEDTDRMVEETVKKFGGLDILVNCAAGNFLVSIST